MLGDYIQQYKQAMKDGNKKEMARIERDLAKMGMDKFTLKILAAEVEA